MTDLLAHHTTFELGGVVREVRRPHTLSALEQELQSFHPSSILILGAGSNVLVSDEGFDGTLIKPELKGIEILHQGSHSVRVRVYAGEVWDDWVAHAVGQGWQGIESLSGIPGWVGAAPIQNIGAYGQEVSSSIFAVHALEKGTGEEKAFSKDECLFAYRSSAFKKRQSPWVIYAVDFDLNVSRTARTNHPEVCRELGGDSSSLLDLRNSVLQIRKRKNMLLDERNSNRRSAGSFFLNPMVTPKQAYFVEAVCANNGWEVPESFPTEDGRVKLSAAWLIERCGFAKGFSLGNARLSTKHCLSIVAQGRATSVDVVKLAKEISSQVKKVFDVDLIPEPTFIGFGQSWEKLNF